MAVVTFEIDQASYPGAAGDASSRLRVLQLINGEHYAGAERVQDLLALRLPAEGIAVAFACLKRGRFESMRQAVETPLVEIPMRGRADILAAWQVATLVRRRGVQILHTHGAGALMVGRTAAALIGVPIVHHVHGNTSSEFSSRRFTRLNALTERILLAKTQRVIAVSPSVAAYLRSVGVPEGRISLIPNGVPSRTSRLASRVEHSPPVLGFVGLLRPRKGLEVLLESAYLLSQRGIEFRIRIVGRFEEVAYERQIHALAERLGLAAVIDWRGFRREVDLELDRMSLLVFPSILPEGMPMVLLEAMAAGVPIVASDIPGVRGLLTNGKHALLVPPEQPGALANSVDKLLNEPTARSQLQNAAIELQRTNYSDQSMAASVAEIYRQVAAERRVIQ